MPCSIQRSKAQPTLRMWQRIACSAAGPSRAPIASNRTPVLGRRIVRPAAQAELGARQRRQLAPQHPGGLGQEAVVGALVDRGVERHVGGVNGLDVVGTAQRRVAPGEGRLEPLPLRARHLAGRQPGADRLDLLHGLEQLGQPGRLQARDDRAAMRPQLDQIHGRQLLERLAHRRARHGKALRHRHLVQPLPRRQLAAHDRLGDGVPQRIGPCAPRLDRPGPDLFQNRSPARGKPGLCRRVADRVNGGRGFPPRHRRPTGTVLRRFAHAAYKGTGLDVSGAMSMLAAQSA